MFMFSSWYFWRSESELLILQLDIRQEKCLFIYIYFYNYLEALCLHLAFENLRNFQCVTRKDIVVLALRRGLLYPHLSYKGFLRTVERRCGTYSSTLRVFIFILWNCGYGKYMFKMKEILCPDCGCQMKAKEVINESLVVMRCTKCKKEFKVTCDEPSFPKRYNKFNWLAFLLPLFWAIGNGAYKWMLICVFLSALSGIPIIGDFFVIPFLIVCVYLGYNGNKIAWNRKKWASIEEFEKVQTNILRGTLIFLVFVAFLLLIYWTQK